MAPPILLPLSLILLIITIHIPPTTSAIPRFGAVPNHDILLSPDSAPFAPRWYEADGVPATPATESMSPNPRYLADGFGLRARQAANACAAGSHNCVEIGAPDLCCENTRYCYLNTTWQPRCCSLGIKCPDSACGPDAQFCNRTVTSTLLFSSDSSSGTGTGTIGLLTYSEYSACCNRACPESSYSCDQAFGGQCCPNGFKCISGNACVGGPAPPTATSVSTIVSEVPAGCTTSQITCAQSDGGGCCGIGSICTFQDAGPTATATSSRIAVCAPDPANDGTSASDGGGLSRDAVIGVAVGISLGAVIVIATITWVCVRKRGTRSRGTGTGASAHEMRRGGTVYNGGGDGGQGTDEDEFGGESMRPGPTPTPWVSRSVTSGRRSLFRGWYGYGGRRNSVHGPRPSTEYDEDDGQQTVHDAANAITPVSGHVSRNTTRGSRRPYCPDDIGLAVEMGDNEGARGGEGSREKDNAQLLRIDETPGLEEDDPHARAFELVGSLPTSPLTDDETYNPMDRDVVSPYQPETGRK